MHKILIICQRRHHFLICAYILLQSSLKLAICEANYFVNLGTHFSTEFASSILEIPLTGCHFCSIASTSP